MLQVCLQKWRQQAEMVSVVHRSGYVLPCQLQIDVVENPGHWNVAVVSVHGGTAGGGGGGCGGDGSGEGGDTGGLGESGGALVNLSASTSPQMVPQDSTTPDTHVPPSAACQWQPAAVHCASAPLHPEHAAGPLAGDVAGGSTNCSLRS